MTCYTDIDYESFPIADLDLDLHWIQLPNSVLAARRQAKLLALERERTAALPKDHKVILRRSGHSSTNNVAVVHAMAEHRGWRNPFPADLDYSPKPKSNTRAK